MLKEAGVCISTDIIVGYPTETEEDFLNKLSDVQRKAFESSVLNAFLDLIKNTNAWFYFFLTFNPTLSLKKIIGRRT